MPLYETYRTQKDMYARKHTQKMPSGMKEYVLLNQSIFG